MCKSLNSDLCVFLEAYPEKTQCVELIDAHVKPSAFQKSNLYVFNDYIISKTSLTSVCLLQSEQRHIF